MKIKKELQCALFETIEKTIKLEFGDRNPSEEITINSLANAIYEDIIELLEEVKKSAQPAENLGFGVEGLIDIDDDERFEEGD